LLARGLGTDIYGSRSISELWPSQIAALEKGLLTDTSNKIIRMPTSAGKTRIAELAIIHTLLSDNSAKCIYVAPYRALVSELEQSFFYILSDLGYKVSSIIGAYESDEFENLLFHETDLLVTTPEKLDLLLRARQDFLQNVRLFILDESHIVNDSTRGIKFEFLMTRLKKRLPNSRILVLSAMMPDDTLRDFANWFNADLNEDIIVSKWRPSVQRYAKFKWSGDNGILLYSSDDDIYLLNQLMPSIIKVNNYEYRNPSTSRINRKRFPDKTNKSQIAAELAYKFAELGPVLIFCSDPKNTEAVASAL
jgi:helicase